MKKVSLRKAINEKWRPLSGLDGFYEVSECGVVRSVERIVNGRQYRSRVITPQISTPGYYVVALRRVGEPIMRSIHRSVAEAFIDNPLELPEVNHIDGDKKNNSIDNLEWVTKSENAKHAWATGLCNSGGHSRGSNHYKTKLNESDVRAIRESDSKLKCIADEFSISISAVRHIRKRRSWKHVV